MVNVNVLMVFIEINKIYVFLFLNVMLMKYGVVIPVYAGMDIF